jgi:hypothetical protein
MQQQEEGHECIASNNRKTAAMDYLFTTRDILLPPPQPLTESPGDTPQVSSMLVCLSGMDSLDEEDRHMPCPIAMEEFDKACVDFLPDDASFIEGMPELCICTLPCKHRFHALSILCHMAISGMRCPVCRWVAARVCFACIVIWDMAHSVWF